MPPRQTSFASGARFLDPTALARIDTLELLARTVVEGFIHGLHRSPNLGLSTDFAEHRQYMPGDDVRRIDWRLFGRTDRYYIKEFEAETNADVLLLLDASRSMDFAGRPGAVTKLDYGRYLAACLAYFCDRQRDRVALGVFDEGDLVEFLPPSGRRLDTLLHTIDRVAPRRRAAAEEERRALAATLGKAAQQLRRRSVVVLISDFYEDAATIVEAIAPLRGRGNDMIAFQLLDPAELEFPFDEAASFEDLESGEVLPIIPEQMRTQYQTAMTTHLETLRRRMGEGQVDFTLVDTSRPLDHALFSFLSTRERLGRVR